MLEVTDLVHAAVSFLPLLTIFNQVEIMNHLFLFVIVSLVSFRLVLPVPAVLMQDAQNGYSSFIVLEV